MALFSAACDDARFSLWAAQCSPIAQGFISLSLTITPVQQPVIVAAPSVPIPLSFAISSLASVVNSVILLIIALTLMQESISALSLTASISGPKTSMIFR